MRSVEGHAKCPTVPQRREILTGTRAAGQGRRVTKLGHVVNEAICSASLNKQVK